MFAEDVDLPLTCTALVVDDGTTRAAWIDFDLIILSTPETQKIQTRVGEETGIPPELVRVSVTHNHAGPPPSSWDWAKAGIDAMKAYYALLPDYAAGAARLAVEKLQPARVGVGKGESTVAVNRRETAPDGRTVTGTNPDGPIDPEVFVMRIDALDGSPIVAAIGYTMHPTTLGPSNKKLSADWPGYLKRTVEQVTGAPTMFAQGATGDIGPGPDGYTDDITVIKRLGISVGAAAVIAYNDIQLPRRNYKHEKVWESGASLGKWTYDAEEGPDPIVRGSTTTVNLPLIELMPFDMAEERRHPSAGSARFAQGGRRRSDRDRGRDLCGETRQHGLPACASVRWQDRDAGRDQHPANRPGGVHWHRRRAIPGYRQGDQAALSLPVHLVRRLCRRLGGVYPHAGGLSGQRVRGRHLALHP